MQARFDEETSNMDFPYRTADITKASPASLGAEPLAATWYLSNRHGMRAEVSQAGGAVKRLDVIGGDLRKHDVALWPHDADSVEAFLLGALHMEPLCVPPVMEFREESGSLVFEHEFRQGPLAGVKVERRLALTDGGELAVGQEISFVDDAKAPVDESRLRRLPFPPLYLNLAGQVPGNVLDHAVAVEASRCVDLSSAAQVGGPATGPADAAGSPADFTRGKALADAILITEAIGGETAGFDWGLMLDEEREAADGILAHPGCSTVYCSRSRVFMTVSTNNPWLRFTTFQPQGGAPVRGKGSLMLGNHSGLAISPATEPGTSLAPGERLTSIAVYKFEPDYPEGYTTDSGCLDSIL
jgi:galactose mutarotase-like enzyme